MNISSVCVAFFKNMNFKQTKAFAGIPGWTYMEYWHGLFQYCILCILPTHVNRRSLFLFFQVTHQVLLSSNVSGQTLLTLIEVNRESLSESLPLVLKREYGCHRRDMRRTELCLSEQLETSASASEIIVVRILNERVTV